MIFESTSWSWWRKKWKNGWVGKDVYLGRVEVEGMDILNHILGNSQRTNTKYNNLFLLITYIKENNSSVNY